VTLPRVHTLRELNGEFVKRIDARTRRVVKTLKSADGVQYLCPVCYEKNGGKVGTHWILHWFTGRGVLDGETPGPDRWNVVPPSTGLDDLTFGPPGAYSLGITNHWHGYMENGTVRVDSVAA
jgi:hypothetical protein